MERLKLLNPKTNLRTPDSQVIRYHNDLLVTGGNDRAIKTWQLDLDELDVISMHTTEPMLSRNNLGYGNTDMSSPVCDLFLQLRKKTEEDP